MGASAAVLLAVSSFAFFAVAGATTHASPTADPATFLRDVVEKPGLAATWAWSQAWLGLLTIPLYLGLFAMLRKTNGAAAMVSLVTGILWGTLLVVVTPLLLALVARAAPAWALENDPAAKARAFDSASLLMSIVATQITLVIMFRALSVFAASIAIGGRLGALGIVFGVEHFAAGIMHQTASEGGVNTALGAAGGIMMMVWLGGVALRMTKTNAKELEFAA